MYWRLCFSKSSYYSLDLATVSLLPGVTELCAEVAGGPEWVKVDESERRLLGDEWLIRRRGVESEWSSALHSQAAINQPVVSGCCQDELLPTRVKPTEACEGRSPQSETKWPFVFFIGQQIQLHQPQGVKRQRAPVLLSHSLKGPFSQK